jgi:PAS domain S-box-containing protein
MRIKTQLLISITTFSVILVIIGLSVALTQLQISGLNNQNVATNDIQTGASDLNYISDNYFLYQDNSYITLWQTKFSILKNELVKLNSTNPQQQELVKTVGRDLEHLNTVFAGVTSFLSNAPRNVSVRVLPSFQTQWDRMAVQIQALAFDSQQLSQNIQDQTNQAITINTILTIALLGAFGAFFVIIYFVAYRRTAKSIIKLKTGISVIGSGNLDYHIEAGNKDEVADISKSVNQMAANLKTVTASKTDLERAQTSLRDSEQRWATTLASIGDAVIATDLLGKITFVNGVAEELTGWTLSEAIGRQVKDVFNIVNEQTREDVENPIYRVLKEGMIVGLANHTILIRKDRTEVPIDDSGAPIKDKDGVITGVVLIFRDISERKEAEEALKRYNEELELRVHLRTKEVSSERQRLFNVLETMPVMVVLLTSDHQVAFANRTFRERFGEDNRRHCYEYCFGKPEPCDFCETYNVLKTGKPHRWQVKSADGSVIDVYAFPFTDTDGSTMVLEMEIDVTEQKRAEAELKKYQNHLEELVAERTRSLTESEEQFRRAIEDAPIPIIMQAEDGQVFQISHKWTDFTGYKLSDIPTVEGWLTKVYGEGANMIRNHMQELFKGDKKQINAEFSIVTLTGEQRFWSFSASSPGTLRDGRRFIVGMAVDVTERKQGEVQLEKFAKHMEQLANERAKKLQDAERLAAIGATAGMVGHDIRNPLQAMISDVYLAKCELDTLPEGEEKQGISESLEGIRKNIEYVNKIVQDLQDFARPITPTAKEFDLKALCEEALMKSELPKKVKGSCEVDELARTMVGDPDLIRRVLTNLIINAGQAMPEGGILSIRAFKKGEDTLIEVQDTGLGIPDDIKPKLFMPLFTTKSKGQGFGLAVVKRVTESMNGTITFESKKGKGATFSVRLPPPRVKQ